MNRELEPRPALRISAQLLPEAPPQGCALKLRLRDGRDVVVAADSTGLVYGVLVREDHDEYRNPIDFSSGDIVSVSQMPHVAQPGYKFA